MKMLPDGANLLRTAHRVFVEEILESVPKEHKYSALMVARAMAIALREHDVGQADDDAELELFEALYGESAVENAGPDTESKLIALNRRLAREIRDGSVDGSCAGALRECLFEQVRAKLRLSNPKYLEGDE